MFDFRKLGVSTISFAAISLIVIVTNSFISNLSLHSVALETKTNPHHSPQNLVNEELVVVEAYSTEDHEDHTHHLETPFNVTDQETSIEELPIFEILKSTSLARQFDGRVSEFFRGGDKCSVQFFMTWISRASLFREKEFLALESLFKSNPNGCLIILSRTMDSALGFQILKPLINRGFRVLALTPDLPFLFKNTPAESWFEEIKKGLKDPGEIPLAQNLSNLIRLAVLFKYGGVYLDTDFIVLKDFSGLKNSIGAQSIDGSGNWTRLNNAALVFDQNHPLLYKFMEEFASTFDGNKWGHNGPYLVSRVVERVQVGGECGNFTVLSPMVFYPVGWTRIAGFFVKPINRIHSKWIEAKLVQLNGATYGVHLWNSQSSRLRIEEGSIISRLVSSSCVICKHNDNS